MTSSLKPDIGQEWHGRAIVTFAGARDTHAVTIRRDGQDAPNPHSSAGQPYDTLALRDIFTMEPGAASKMEGLACIPSIYAEHDARAHKVQQEHGAFVALAADIDTGNASLDTVRGVVEGVVKDAAWLVYSSAHACPGDMRWRVIIPTHRYLPFEVWNDAQNALFRILERFGLECDRALERAGQPVYLPNVPDHHEKTGEMLRDESGKPRFFARATSGLDKPALDIAAGIFAEEIALIKREREADERERARLRAEAEQRRTNRAHSDGGSIIDEFNLNNSVADLLQLYGYEQCPRNGDDWRSPMQTSGSYATRVIGDKWVSLSASDAASGVGQSCRAGCYGDAYDLFLHFEHQGDQKSAFRQLYAERRATAPTPPPPPVQTDDPGWTEPPEGPDPEQEPEIVPDFIDEPESETDPLGFDITEWSSDRFQGSAPPIEWLCQNTIPQGVPALFAALGGIGKSFIALDLALEIAAEITSGSSRRILGGEVVARGSVVVLSAEDSKDSIHRRLEKIDPGGRREAAQGRVFVVPLPEVGGPMPLVSGDRGEMRRTDKFDALLNQLRRIPDLRLVIIDPLQAFVTADITKDPAAGQFMWSSFAQICAETGASVIACHHMRKEGMSKIDSSDAAREAIRGSTALIDGARATYALWGAGEDDSRRICQELGVEHQPKRVINGAVVKSNDEHDWEVHTYLRAESGLLEDCSEGVRELKNATGRLTAAQEGEVFEEIARRWEQGNPFSASANARARFLPNWLRQEFGIGKKAASDHLDEWMIGGKLASEMCDKHRNLIGLKVAKWPN
jgi:hypothetical protein